MRARWHILVVDDEEAMTESLAAWLREDGYTVDTASSGREAIEKARAREYAIYFVDLKMPGGLDGIETMMEIRKLQKEASVIVITAYATVDTAIAAMKEGAQEYVVKPCHPQEISLLVERIIRVKNLERENAILRRKLTRQYRFHDLVSKNPRMAEIFDLVREIASQRSTVLIQGESGTGKELVARAIHFSGDRGERPVRGRLLRRPRGDAAGVGALRAREGLVHRRHRPEEGQVRAGRRGHHLPRRDRRHLAQAAGGPPARAPGAALLPGGRHDGDRGGRAGHRRHPPGPRRGRAGGPLPRRPLLPPQRDQHPHPARCGSGSRTCPSSRRSSSTGSPTSWAARCPASPRRRCASSWTTTGRATCASSRTRSSGPS